MGIVGATSGAIPKCGACSLSAARPTLPLSRHPREGRTLRECAPQIRPSRDLRHKASIPLALYDDWLRDAYRQGIPIYHKRERDDWLKKRLDQHEGLKISGKATGRVGFSGGYGNAMQAKPNVTMKA